MRTGIAPAVAVVVALAMPLASPPAAASELSAAEVARRMIEAHGGMERWAAAPTVSWEEEFRPGQAQSGAVTRVLVEQGRRRAAFEFPGTEMRMAWDGERAWSLNWQSPYPPRFLALLNYYFLNLPWLTQDPGVVLQPPGSGRLFDDPTDYVTVRMEFEAGVGDTPDDYYVLYVHPETYRLRACEYVVTYQALLPEGVEVSNPHILVYDELTEAGGLVVPAHYTIYELDGSVFATGVFRDWSFERPFDPALVAMPEGAVVDESTP